MHVYLAAAKRPYEFRRFVGCDALDSVIGGGQPLARCTDDPSAALSGEDKPALEGSWSISVGEGR